MSPKSRAAAPDTLAPYRAKRNFSITPEPDAPLLRATEKKTERHGRAAAQFVVQKHWARRLHYDLRLEVDGTMKSWAVPKGPSLDPAVKRMAVQVEDHPIAYNTFEGTIPAGQYGAGTVILWDRGTWIPATDDPATDLASGKIKFELIGHKLKGRWALVRMGGKAADEHAWLLIKEKDQEARAASQYDITKALPDSVVSTANGATTQARGKTAQTRASTTKDNTLPETLAPQLATRVSAAPGSGAWLYELKYDGYRILARVSGGKARLHTRQGHDWTRRLPTVAAQLEAATLPDGWYDGEIVVLDDDGRPDFQALQNALDPHAGRPRNGRRPARAPASPDTVASARAEITYFLFDLPWFERTDLRERPLHERRTRLEAIMEKVEQPGLRLSAIWTAPARDLLRSACELGLEGVIGKLRTSRYGAGRSGHWIKLKCGERQEFVIGGYTDPKGGRTGFGALLLGYYDEDGALRYAGNVGSGFTDATLRELHARLEPLQRSSPPFTDAPRAAGTHWVAPRLAAEVAFTQWTDSGRVRHAVFLGLRHDKPVSHMKKESSRTITNAERLIDTASGARKGDVAAYYQRAAGLIMPHLKDRPVAMLRAPDGLKGELFFQKHMEVGRMDGLMQLDPALDPGHDPLVVVRAPAGLNETAQLNVIEFHTWNAVRDRIDRPDRITFDLDPGQGVKWAAMQEAAHLLRSFLQELGLPAFVKTSGGKGLHVVVPIVRRYDWDTAKGFSRAVVQHMADVLPKRFSAKSGPRNRVGKIFIDYLRNGFGATTVAAWSLRARPGMGISVPIDWDEVDMIEGGDHWSVSNIDERLDTGNTPWAGYADSAAALGPAMKRLGYENKGERR